MFADYGTFMIVMAGALLSVGLGVVFLLACLRYHRDLERFRQEAIAFRHIARHVVAVTLRCPRCLKHTITIASVDDSVESVSICAICRVKK